MTKLSAVKLVKQNEINALENEMLTWNRKKTECHIKLNGWTWAVWRHEHTQFKIRSIEPFVF